MTDQKKNPVDAVPATDIRKYVDTSKEPVSVSGQAMTGGKAGGDNSPAKKTAVPPKK